jgi:hypothetical protein
VGRTLPGFLAAGSIAMLAVLLAGGRAGKLGAGLFAVLAVLFPVALIALGTRREWPRLGAVVIALAAILTLSAIGILLLPANGPAADHVLGLPPATWLMLVGLGLAPLVLVLWSYTATFRPPDRAGDGRAVDSDRAHG